MHVYQMRSSNPQVVEATQQRLTVCMNALKDISKVWLVAKMVHTLFESILGNKHLEERLQKAAGKRHAKSKSRASLAKTQFKVERESQPPKRKFDDLEMSMGYSGGPPAAQMSYERSRPVSPVANATPSRETSQQQQLPQISTSSPPVRLSHDAFMGDSRSGTRQTTPFNTYSYPGTPPDLFLHTRNTPNISSDLWQNYQPDQLFPPDAAVFDISSPQQQMVDPALRTPQHYAPQAPMQAPSMQAHVHSPPGMQGHGHSHHSDTMQAANGLQAMQYSHNPAAWAQLQAMEQQQAAQQRHRLNANANANANANTNFGEMGADGHGADDTWSNSSNSGPIVPTTLNVGDW